MCVSYVCPFVRTHEDTSHVIVCVFAPFFSTLSLTQHTLFSFSFHSVCVSVCSCPFPLRQYTLSTGKERTLHRVRTVGTVLDVGKVFSSLQTAMSLTPWPVSLTVTIALNGE